MSTSEPPTEQDPGASAPRDNDLLPEEELRDLDVPPSDEDGGSGNEVVAKFIEYGTPPSGADFRLQNARIERQKNLDNYRNRITNLLLIACGGLTVGMISVAGLVGLSDTHWSRVNSLVPIVVSPFYTLLAIAIGYYFGSQSRK